MFAMGNYAISYAIFFHEFIYVFTFKYLVAFAGTKLKFVCPFSR